VDKPEQALLDRILSSPAAADWQARIVAGFFDREDRHAVIEQVRAEVATRAVGVIGPRLERLQQAVVARLVGLASRDASAPAPDAASADLLMGGELEDRIVREYPYTIAAPFTRLAEQESAAGAFGCLLDTLESLLHFLATTVVSAYLRTDLAQVECNRVLLDKLVKGGWSTGDLFGLLRDTVRLAADCAGQLPYPELPGYLFTPAGRPTASHRVLDAFVTLRNRAWGHGTGRDEAFYATILPANRARLEGELARLRFLTRRELIRPITIDETGRVTRADLLMGNHRRKGRDYDLQLDPRDQPGNGGDVRVEKTLLLVSLDRHQYLPLFPLSLFHFRLAGQGVYFLQRPLWERADGRRRLRKAGYVAYESGLEPHEEGPGDAAARSLEAHVHQLEASSGGYATATGDVDSPASEDPDYELAEVRHEQQFHLRTFAGREAVLAEVQTWLDRGTDDYLLLLGPPGQGKSALMAELARREQQRGGCLLHMIKSHRGPSRFVPSVISQAARLSGARFGQEAYRGDLDDLRNSLVRGLESVRDRSGRAVLLVDALDELETIEGRVSFLPVTLPAGVKVVLTCRPDVPLVQSLRARLERLQERALQPMSAADLPALLERRLGPAAVSRLAGRVNWPALFARTGGNPLFLSRALGRIERVVNEASAGELAPIDLSELPATFEALFQGIYDEIAEKQGIRYATLEGRQKARLLQLLCEASEPLGFDQLRGLSAATDQPLSLEDCRDRLFEMSQYLLDAGNNRFKPWHEGLTEFVRGSILGTEGILQVRTVFCRWLAQPGIEAQSYALRYRVRHLLDAGMHDEACELLVDPRFLESKAEAGFVFELADDFTRTLATVSMDQPRRSMLRLLEEAIRTDIHFLARHPGCLFQCLWNRGWWFDCPEAAGFYRLAVGTGTEPIPPWLQPGPKLCHFLESWWQQADRGVGEAPWLRCLMPPSPHLGSAQLVVYAGHTRGVTGVAVAPDGTYIASVSSDGQVRLWEPASGIVLRQIKAGKALNGVAISPDSRLVAVAAKDGSILVWDRGGLEVGQFQVHQAEALCVTFTPDGRQLVSGSEDQTIRGCDPFSGEERVCFHGHDHWVTCVAVSEDGIYLASGSTDSTVRVWNLREGREIVCLRGHSRRVNCVAFSPDGSLASGASDMSVRLWDWSKGKELLCLSGHHSHVWGVAISPDGRQLASAAFDRTVRVWDAVDGRPLNCFEGHGERITAVAYAHDGAAVVSGSTDRTMRLWDTRRRGEQIRLLARQTTIWGLAFSPNGNHLASAGDGIVVLWDARTGRPLTTFQGHEGVAWCVAFSPDGTRLASGSIDNTIRLWDTRSGVEQLCIRGHGRGVLSVDFSRDGREIVSGSMDGSIRVWDAELGNELLRLHGHTSEVEAVAFSHDNCWIASGGEDTTVRIWSRHYAIERNCFKGHKDTVNRIAFSPDGRQVVSGSLDRTLCTWDPFSVSPSREPIQLIRGTGDPVALAAGPLRFPVRALSRNGETLVESSRDEKPLAWYPDDFHQIVTHPSGTLWCGVSESAFSLFALEGIVPTSAKK
jgi:WD40 repeat protein